MQLGGEERNVLYLLRAWQRCGENLCGETPSNGLLCPGAVRETFGSCCLAALGAGSVPEQCVAL